MPKILVTGGNGYIGSHTCVALLKEGYDVVVIDNLSNSRAYVQNQIAEIAGRKPQFYNLDLQDATAVNKVVAENPDIDAVIHFAAHLIVDESVSNPLKYYRNNLVGLINLLDAFQDAASLHFVFSSSCTVYGNPDQIPISEKESIKSAVSPYGNTKKVAEEILQDFGVSQKGVNVISLRYFNPIGAHASGLLGEDPLGHHVHLVPIIAEVASGKRDELKVYGGDYNTPDGTCIRDYIHVVDLAQAHVKAVELLLSQKGQKDSTFNAINVGSGRGQTVLEVVKAFEKATGLNIPYKIVDRRPGDAEKIFADISKAKKELQWSPELSIDDMLQSAYKWENSKINIR